MPSLTVLAPGDCVAYVEEQLDAFAALSPDDPCAMPVADQAAIRAQVPVVGDWVDQVAALRLPLTLCHNDLHGNNVFDVDGGLRFFDFADALVTEPLAALLIPLHTLSKQLGADTGDPRLQRVAAPMNDAELAEWGAVAGAWLASITTP